ncbi:hypothetical protein D3C75_624550 [compost metagenome]
MLHRLHGLCVVTQIQAIDADRQIVGDQPELIEHFGIAARVETIADHATIHPDRRNIEIISDLARIAHQLAANGRERCPLSSRLGQRLAILFPIQHQGLVTTIAGNDDPVGKHLTDPGLSAVDVIPYTIGVLQPVVGDDGDGFCRIGTGQHPVELGVELGLGGIDQGRLGNLVGLQLLRLAKQGETADVAEIEAGRSRALARGDSWLPGRGAGRLGQLEQTPGEHGALLGQQQQQQPEQRLAETGEWHCLAASQKGAQQVIPER